MAATTSIDMHAVYRDARESLLEFAKLVFLARKGATFIENWHHVAIANALERVVMGEIKRLIINIPPRYSKTELAVVNFIPWCFGWFPDAEFIHASYSKRLATNNSWNARAIVEHEIYQHIFGVLTLRHDSNAKDEWRTEAGGCVYATGSEGAITGYGAGKMRDSFGGCILIDDPHKAGEANSPVRRQNVIDWFQTTMESRTNSKDTPIIIVMQRLHEDDLSGFLLSGGNGEEWEHLNIPARNDSGEPLWPAKHNDVELARLETSNAYMFAGQYMQRPAPIGGGIFKDEWWRFYRVLPRIQYRNIYADTAQKTKEKNDYSVFQCWGRGYENQRVLIDQIRGKWEAPELLVQARAFWKKHQAAHDVGTLRAMKIEDKSSGTGLIQTLQREGIPVLPIQRGNDKISRAYDVSPSIEAGLVYLPEGAPWLSEYLAEFSLFPNGAHDDQVDPTMDAITDETTTSKIAGTKRKRYA